MILFWVLSTLLAAAALVLLVRPLLSRREGQGISRSAANLSIYRDQLRELEADLAAGTLAGGDYDRARRELETRLLEDVDQPAAAVKAVGGRRMALVLGIAIPALAVALYFAIGNPGALDPRRAADGEVTAQQIEAMVERLAARLRENPDDADGWKLLGRSHAALGRFADAVNAYAKAASQAPRDPQLLADFADALAMTRGESLQGEPEKLVLRALEIYPGNLKALALAGTAAFERKDYKAATGHWQRMLPLVPPDSKDARAIQSSIDEARALAGTGAAKPTGLRGIVRIAPELKGKVAPDDSLFIFARAADGPPMPLAVLRVRARDLPVSFALDDSMAMAPSMRLSGFQRVVVSARVSKSAGAAPQPGDLQGSSAPVASDAAGVTVVIDTVVR
ncbi:MAG: c-type cytochrome biogenesis protein CcmI [Betaproteobacteria bacterium RIFCSPLOWO2_12_FULL_68_20]|nr:MAG: c-type cytochrome biogenesis protein CcmI [Betaproteobacteria bacterium RIFCSPLOWO2_12_FULL_68_20]